MCLRYYPGLWVQILEERASYKCPVEPAIMLSAGRRWSHTLQSCAEVRSRSLLHGRLWLSTSSSRSLGDKVYNSYADWFMGICSSSDGWWEVFSFDLKEAAMRWYRFQYRSVLKLSLSVFTDVWIIVNVLCCSWPSVTFLEAESNQSAGDHYQNQGDQRCWRVVEFC